jgi:CRP-like cAMP-binding protein
MYYVIQQELARHQADRLREAEQHRLALVARGETARRRRLSSFLARVHLKRPQQRPAPAI